MNKFRKPGRKISAIFATMLMTLITGEHVFGGEPSFRGWGESTSDPLNQLNMIDSQNFDRDVVFSVSPLTPLREGFGQFKDQLYDATNLRLGVSFHHLFQGATNYLPGTDHWAF